MDYKFKAGDRVRHAHDPEDEGTFMSYNGDDSAKVKWDNDGEMSNLLEFIYLVESSDKEQEAVMLLLNLGYTVSKNY